MRSEKFHPKIIGFCLLLITIVLFVCSDKHGSNDKETDLIIGVKIYQHLGSYKQLFNEWNALSVNTVFVSDSLAANTEFRSLARENNITTFVICPIFYDPNPEFPAITERGEPAVDEWVHFACPSRETYRKQKIDWIREFVTKYYPDGISIDFIRFFAYWEKIYPHRLLESLPNTCFDDHCLEKFQTDTKITIPTNLKTIPEIDLWIQENHESTWVEWKCHVITSMIRDIVIEAKKVKPDLLINVHAVPWRQNDFGGAIRKITAQDFKSIAEYVDYLSPMCYFHMVKQKPAWIHSVVRDLFNQTGSHVLPSIQVEKAYLDDPLTTDAFRQAFEASLKPPSKGVVFWNWESLSQSAEKMEIVKQWQN